MFSLYVTDELFIDLQRWKSQTSTQFSQPCRPRQFNLDGFPTTCEQLRDEKKQHLEVKNPCPLQKAKMLSQSATLVAHLLYIVCQTCSQNHQHKRT